MLTKGAIGNLVNRYRAVLKKCNLINTFGSLAVVSMLVLGGAGVASAANITEHTKISESVTYDNLTATGVIYDRQGESGAVIAVGEGGSLTVDGTSTFSENKNEKAAGGALANGYTYSENALGGTISFGGKATFTKNISSDRGGAIFMNGGTVSFGNEAEFTSNEGGMASNPKSLNQGGGAIYQDGGTLTFSDKAIFDGNVSESYGGAIHTYNGTLTFEDAAEFKENISKGTGGAVAISGGTTTFKGAATFEGNEASGMAGALYIDRHSGNTPTVTFKNSATFTGNKAGGNGIIYNVGKLIFEEGLSLIENDSSSGPLHNQTDKGEISILGDAIFSKNNGGNGGALKNGHLLNIGTESEYVEQISFRENKTETSGGAIDNGGAINFYGKKITFVENEGKGKYGSAIFNAATINIVGETIEFTKNKENASKVSDSTDNSFFKAGGGAIHNRGNTDGTVFTLGKSNGSVTFSENHANQNGGAILSRAVDGPDAGATMVINGNTTFAGNTAGGMGGAIFNYVARSEDNFADSATEKVLGGSSSITFNGDTTFSGNSAEDKGGAIYNSGTITFNKNVTFSGNTADGVANDIHNDGTIVINGTASLDGGITGSGSLEGAGTVVIASTDTVVKQDSVASTLTAQATGDVNDQLSGDTSSFEKMGFKNVQMEEGLIAGEVTKNADGTMLKKVNTVLADTLEQATAAPLAVNRILMNDVRKRMGDLRSDKNESGVWMRWDGGKLQGDGGLTNNFNTIQIGGDTKVAKNCRFGVAGSFTHGDIDHNNGGGEQEAFTFAAYGTWMAENGMFADVIARVGFNNSELQVKGGKADIDNEALSLSAEYGWRLPVCDQFFLEPQVELTYTHVTGADFTIKTDKYDIDSMDSVIGRAGLVAGWNLPNEMGNVYARASVVHEFLGDAKITATNNGGFASHKLDGDDTWIEYGIGANVKLTDKTYIWADVERTEGASIDEEWRGTVGIRYSF